jgi:hypothetical protein
MTKCPAGRVPQCPPDPAATVPIETAQMKVKIRKDLHAEVYFDFMALMLRSGLVFG